MSVSTTAWSWACFGCTDFINDARLVAYHRWACANDLYECDSRPELLDLQHLCPNDGDPGDYSDPATDGVCWYDPNLPDSEEFLGVLVQRVTGSRSSTFQREAIDSATLGSLLKVETLRGRSFGFEIILIGTSCRGVEYGIEWLRRTLELGGCDRQDSCDQCRTRNLKARIYCDDSAEDNGLREWVGVGLIDGLAEVPGRLEWACCCLRAFTFSMQAESPFSYSPVGELVRLDADGAADSPDAFDACYDWALGCVSCGSEACLECEGCGSELDACEACREKCGQCNRCGWDPVCGLQQVRPARPLFLQPDDCVVCEPINRVIQAVNITDVDRQIDQTFVVDLFSGMATDNPIFSERGLRNAAVKFYPNPQGAPPITDQASYDYWRRRSTCAELRVRHVPPNATIRIDGKAERVTLLCDGKCRPYDEVVAGPSAASIFPIVASCYPVMISVEWDLTQTQFDEAPPARVRSALEVRRFRRWRS